MRDYTMPTKISISLTAVLLFILSGCYESTPPQEKWQAACYHLDGDAYSECFDQQRLAYESNRSRRNEALIRMGSAGVACSAYGGTASIGAMGSGKCNPPPQQNLSNISQTNKIYDELNNYIGTIRDGIIYDTYNNQVGRVRGNIIYNNNSYQIGRIQGSTIFLE